MDTLIAAILLVIALLIVRAIAQIRREDAQQRRRTYRADVAQRAVQRGGDVLEDVVYLWRLRSSGYAASRRAVMRSHEMSGYRWGKANAVIKHLNLDPTRISYDEGVERIRQFVADQERLSRSDTYVPPV